MCVVDYNGEKLKGRKLVMVKNGMCSPNEKSVAVSVVHRQLSVFRLARDWLTCRGLPQSRSDPLQEQFVSNDCSMQDCKLLDILSQLGTTLKGHSGFWASHGVWGVLGLSLDPTVAWVFFLCTPTFFSFLLRALLNKYPAS